MKTKLKILSIEDNQKDQKSLEQHIASENLPYELTADNILRCIAARMKS